MARRDVRSEASATVRSATVVHGVGGHDRTHGTLTAMSSRRALLSSFAVVVLFALPLLSEILGAQRLVFRDTQITHWPWRRVATASLAAGEVPFVNAAASGGQPLLANPNAVLLYPTFLLERVVPPASAFNLHYLLHVLWAFFGARRLGRALGLAEDAAFLSGVAFAFSGMMLSYGSAFMNSIAAAAWLPWCAAAILALERSRGFAETARASVATGLALGLQLLAGEPAISLLTGGFAGALALLRALGAPPGEKGRRLLTLAAGGAGAVVLALALAAPLLLPLAQVFPMTYRGQHHYSERAFGAAAFTPERAVEWLLPRFGGDPGTLGGGANWLASVAGRELVYIWAVTFGFVPLLLVLAGALSPGFWNRRSGALAAGGLLALLLSFGFALPLYQLVYAVTFLRKLRYPVKFYLLTTLCVALLAGLAVEALARRRSHARSGGPEAAVAAVLLLLLGAAWLLAAPGGALDRWAGPDAAKISDSPGAFLAVFRTAVRGDVLVGAVAVLAAVLALRRGGREPGYLLGFVTLLSALVFGLPLFVNAREKDLARPPALAARVAAAGKAPRRARRARRTRGGHRRSRERHTSGRHRRRRAAACLPRPPELRDFGAAGRDAGNASALGQDRARDSRGARGRHRIRIRRPVSVRQRSRRLLRIFQPRRERGGRRIDAGGARPPPPPLWRALGARRRGRRASSLPGDHRHVRRRPAAHPLRAREPAAGAALGGPLLVARLALRSAGPPPDRPLPARDRRRLSCRARRGPDGIAHHRGRRDPADRRRLRRRDRRRRRTGPPDLLEDVFPGLARARRRRARRG